MAKMLKFPTNDILREFRIKALTTPLSAYEMTNLDKDMGDILERSDLPMDRKLKLYHEALNKFQVSRKSFLDEITTAASTDDEKPKSNSVVAHQAVKPFEETPLQQTEESMANSMNETPSRQKSVKSHLRDSVDSAASSPVKNADSLIMETLNNDGQVMDEILKEFKQSSGGVIYSPTSPKQREMGHLNDLEKIISHFLNPKKGKLGKNLKKNELVAPVSEYIQKHYLSKFSSKTKPYLDEMYPNLFSSPDDEPKKIRSPVQLRSTTSKGQTGQGIRKKKKKKKAVGIKIAFNKWNQLVSL
jgi:truncated hemoglobin YjbI